MKKLTTIISSAVLLTAMGSVNAEPVSLTEAQLDSVSAGAAFATAGSTAGAFGLVAISDTDSFTITASFLGNGYAYGESEGTSFAIFGVAGSSASSFAASN